MALCREGSERGQCCCLASGVVSRRKLSPCTCPDGRHFNFSLYATGALPAAASMLEPRGSESAWVLSLLRALQEETAENLAVSFAAPPPTGFYSQKLWGFIFLALEPWARWSGMGLGFLTPEVFLPIFMHHTWVSTTCSVSMHLSLRLCFSTLPTYVDECDFFHVLNFFWWFWVIVVVWSSCDFCYSCVRGWAVFAYTSILTGMDQTFKCKKVKHTSTRGKKWVNSFITWE